MKENDISLLDETKDELNHIYSRISQLYNMGLDAFSKRRTDNFKKMSNLHKEILELISKSRDEHVHRLGSQVYSVELSKSIYSVLFSLERIADHIVNVAFSVKSTTGSKTEALQAIAKEKKR